MQLKLVQLELKLEKKTRPTRPSRLILSFQRPWFSVNLLKESPASRRGTFAVWRPHRKRQVEAYNSRKLPFNAIQGFKFYVEAEDPDVLILTETKVHFSNLKPIKLLTEEM
jgi:hypothetical protein